MADVEQIQIKECKVFNMYILRGEGGSAGLNLIKLLGAYLGA